MKKIILLLLFISLNVYSQETQEIGTYKLNFKEFKGNASFGTWYKMSAESFAVKFSLTTIGAKNCIETTEALLSGNNIEFSKPQKDKSYLSSIVKDLHDYETLSLTLNTENSVVDYIWFSEKYFVILKMDKDSYTIAVLLRK